MKMARDSGWLWIKYTVSSGQSKRGLGCFSWKPMVMMLTGQKELVKKLQWLDNEVVLLQADGQMMVF